MYRHALLAMLLASSSLLLIVSEARAGIVVTDATGAIFYESQTPVFEGGTETYTPQIPGSDQLRFLEGEVGQTSSRDGSGRLTVRARTLIDSNVGSGSAPDCRASFEMTFTSDLPLQYRFTASLLDQGPLGFVAKVDDITGSAFYDAFGNGTGSLPFDENTGQFGEFVSEGTLPAGSHTFSLDAVGAQGRSVGLSTAGTATLEVVAIPLPPAAWSALTTLGAIGAAAAARVRRRH
jgi:hypothetical protein